MLTMRLDFARCSLALSLLAVIGLASAARAADEPDLRSQLEKRTFKNEAGDTLPYRLFIPKGYDAKQAYPVILFLHGYGENGTNNEAQLKHADVLRFVSAKDQAARPCFLVAPQNPKDLWPGKSSLLAMEILDALSKEFNIDADRRYVTGLSSGGMGTYFCLSERPDYFAAAVPVCGSGKNEWAPKIAHIPAWGFCGSKDGGFVEKMKSLNEAVEKAGGKWKYTEYEGVGHNSWHKAYAEPELGDWLFQQKRKKAETK
jgi:predicted peptidase